jgi:hypothetical protein
VLVKCLDSEDEWLPRHMGKLPIRLRIAPLVQPMQHLVSQRATDPDGHFVVGAAPDRRNVAIEVIDRFVWLDAAVALVCSIGRGAFDRELDPVFLDDEIRLGVVTDDLETLLVQQLTHEEFECSIVEAERLELLDEVPVSVHESAKRRRQQLARRLVPRGTCQELEGRMCLGLRADFLE